MTLIDSHCHLTDKKFTDVAGVIAAAAAVGVEKIIVPGTSRKDCPRVIQLTHAFGQVYGLVGIYPGEVDHAGELPASIDQLRVWCQEEAKILGIGEIGLDGYWNRCNGPRQQQFFAAQLKLAVELDLPVAIHSRQSGPEIKAVFETLDRLPRGQFHCFGEGVEFLEYILDRGFYVSYCGNITYPSADSLRQLCLATPLNRLLLETDAPYLPPQKFRNQVNTPANVKITAAYIAKLKSLSLAELASATTASSRALYKLPPDETNTPVHS